MVLLLIFSIIVVYPVVLNPSFKILETNFIPSNSYTKQNILRICIVIFTIIMGIVSIGGFENVIALVGSAISTPIALIFPTIFHYKLFKNKQSRFRSMVDLFISGLGICLSLTIMIFTFIHWDAKP